MVLLSMRSRFALICSALFIATIVSAQQTPANASGSWTVSSRGEDGQNSTQSVQLTQKGGELTGHFKGPHQSGGITGNVTGNHVFFETKTRDVLHFRGTVQGDTMEGTIGARGKTGVFTATRAHPL